MAQTKNSPARPSAWVALAPVLALTLALALMMASCGDSKDGTANKADQSAPLEVILIPKVTNNAFFESANAGAQEYAQKHGGFSVSYRGNDVASVDNQIKIVKAAIADKAKALTISALDAKALDKILKEAQESGMVVTTWDSDVSSDARRLMVSQGTPSQLGKMLVEMASKALRQRGKHPSTEPIKYVWHYSQASVADQNSWYKAGEEYIKESYPQWINLNPDNYYSEQDPKKALAVGKAILAEHPDIDAIICNDSTSLPGQAEALKELGLSAKDVTVTGFASPNAIKQYARDGIIDRWGLWDCKVQAALACYLTWYLASGNDIKTGQTLDVPEIGLVELMPNSVLDHSSVNIPGTGVVLLPNRTEFTLANMDNYDF
ncbi:MAG: substrate-binding domain-containing protein [Deltaproteobacteria bacterium]|jgi:AI-2 transport system substrate-binding protein|nr:substrate-binding domain-containing protein [Deltaproteobacteria bacterium]